MLLNKQKVVCIGGGSGLSHLIKGFKDMDNIDLKCIVTVADNGGSSGILKEELNIPAVGDIRNVLIALANVPEDLSKLMNYRFINGGLSGHSVGNILIAGLLELDQDNFANSLKKLSSIFNVRGEIIPASNEVIDIKATMFDNSKVYGEKNIGVANKKIQKIEYISKVAACNEAIEAINEADIIIYSIGSLFTSLIPNLIIPEIRDALEKSHANKVYFANLMSQPGETDDLSLSKHVEAINNHLGFSGVDFIIINSEPIPKEILERYKQASAYPVEKDFEKLDKQIKIIEKDIIEIENGRIVHSPEKIGLLLKEEIECHFQEM